MALEEKTNRAQAIESALAQIDKQFGKGSIMRLGSRERVEVPAISTGSLSLDAALQPFRPQPLVEDPLVRGVLIHEHQAGLALHQCIIAAGEL